MIMSPTSLDQEYKQMLEDACKGGQTSGDRMVQFSNEMFIMTSQSGNSSHHEQQSQSLAELSAGKVSATSNLF